MQEDEPQNIGQPIADEDGRFKGRRIKEGNKPGESQRQRDVYEKVVPPGQGREHESNPRQQAALEFAFPTHASGLGRAVPGRYSFVSPLSLLPLSLLVSPTFSMSVIKGRKRAITILPTITARKTI